MILKPLKQVKPNCRKKQNSSKGKSPISSACKAAVLQKKLETVEKLAMITLRAADKIRSARKIPLKK